MVFNVDIYLRKLLQTLPLRCMSELFMTYHVPQCSVFPLLCVFVSQLILPWAQRSLISRCWYQVVCSVFRPLSPAQRSPSDWVNTLEEHSRQWRSGLHICSSHPADTKENIVLINRHKFCFVESAPCFSCHSALEAWWRHLLLLRACPVWTCGPAEQAV